MNILVSYLVNLSRPQKKILTFSLDLFLCVLSVWFSFYLRLGEYISFSWSITAPLIKTSFFAAVVAMPLFVFSGLYRVIFRYSILPGMRIIAITTIFYGLIFSTFFTLIGMHGVPRTIGIIHPIIFFVLMSTSRAVARVFLLEFDLRGFKSFSAPRVLIYGAGSSGRQLAAAIANTHDIRAVGFLDDDKRLHGHNLNGLPIYNPEDIEEVVKRMRVTEVLLSIPSSSQERRKQILRFLSKFKLSIRTVPDLKDIFSGKFTINDVRDLDISDLLGRETIKPNEQLLMRNTHCKTVLLTGAGGSIGSELCRQVLKTNPKRLLLVEMNEFALYQIHQEIQADVQLNQMSTIVIPLLASVCDEARMNMIMQTWQPDTVFHAAAYKHVPLVEHNPSEAIINNVLGTKVCAEAAARNGVCNFVLVSTDKAVRPTNVMGATKRLAEMVLQALNHKKSQYDLRYRTANNTSSFDNTCFSMVRFGNVLGSSGSVLPLFREQIKNGGPITLTHTEITRFFMTIPEAAQLVIQAGAMGTGGDVFLLDMGSPVRIYDLAKQVVQLSGLTIKSEKNPNGDIEIKVTGMRPGEKLYEELLIGDNSIPTQHLSILKAHEMFIPWEELQGKLDTLFLAASDNDVILIRSLLKQLVTGYQPSDTLVDWVYMQQRAKLEGFDKNNR